MTVNNSSLSFPLSYLSEYEGLLVVGRVQSVVHHHTCAILFPDGVCGQTVHVHLHVCAYFLVWQKLSGNHLKRKSVISKQWGFFFLCDYFCITSAFGKPPFVFLTCTLQVAAITPSTGVSENGSNILSDRRIKSGFRRYLTHTRTHRQTVT